MIGLETPPESLQTDALLALFGENRANARKRYARFVSDGRYKAGPWEQLRGQIYLGDELFVKRMQGKMKNQRDDLNIPKAQRRPPAPTLANIAERHADRNMAIFATYATGQYSYKE